MTIQFDALDQHSALLCGTGKYAHQLASALVTRRGWKAINLTANPTVQNVNFMMVGGLYRPVQMINQLRDQGVRRIVVGGDLDSATRFDTDLLLSAFAPANWGVVYSIFRKWQHSNTHINLVVLRELERLLQEANIEPVHPTTVVPDLQIPKGPINAPASKFNDEQIRGLVSRAFPSIRTQTAHDVSQAVIMDGCSVVLSERKNTRKLLLAAKEVPMVLGKTRSLIKLTPSEIIPPNLDPPVIGEDTIDEARAAGIELIVLDHRHGIMAQRTHTIEAATSAAITLYGYDTAS